MKEFILFVVLAQVPLSFFSQNCSLVGFNVAPSPTSAPKKDTTVCKGRPLNLYASIPTLKQPTSYTVSAIPYIDTLPCETTGSVIGGSGINQDDQYSPLQSIGFNFCFYGTSYSQLTICDNGYLTFTASKANSMSAPFTAETLPLATSSLLPPNSILGAMMDVLVATNYTPPGGGTISVQTVGVTPFRAFIVKYSDCQYFATACRSNTAIRYNMKIILYETTNMIDIYVNTKPICISGSSSMYNSTQGLVGPSITTQFVATPGRNNSLWTGTNTAYRFTPNGSNYTTALQWTKNGSVISNTNTASITATDDSAFYVATATITATCPSSTLVVKDSIKVYGLINNTTSLNVYDTIRCIDSLILNASKINVKKYIWDNGSNLVTRTINTAGTYYVVRNYDTVGCNRDTLFFNIVKNTKLKIDSFQRIGCFQSQNNGQIKIFISGDTMGTKYGLNFPPTSTNSRINNIGYGARTVWVVNNGGCKDSLTFFNDSLSTNFTKRNNFCIGDSSGMMKLPATGGYSPYTYSLTGRSNQAADSFTKLTGGVYSIAVTDKVGCMVSKTDTIVPTTNLALQIITDSVSCNGGSNGKITAILTGGNPPYSFAINTGSLTNNNVFNGLSAQPYLIKTKDNTNCRIDTNITVKEYPAIVATFTNTKNCLFQNNGSITVYASGGKPIYTYKLGSTPPFTTSNIFSNLYNGIHTITVKDANNCTMVFYDTLTSYPKPDLTVWSKKNISCYGLSDGKVKLQTTSGTSPYSYNWSYNTVNQDSMTAIPFSASPIFVTVTDMNTCKDTLMVTLTQPDSVYAIFITKNPLCFNQANGSVKIIGIGGTKPYQFSINSGSHNANDTFTSLGNGIHNIVMRDSNLCTKSFNVSLVNPTKLNAVIVIDSVSCFGSNNGKITVNGLNATPPYKFNINVGNYSSANIFTGLTAGTYSLSIRDTNNCQLDTSGTVYQYPKINTSINVMDTIRCKNGSDGKISIAASGGVSPYTYAINGGGFQSSNIFSSLNKGKKIIQIKDAKNCIVTDSIILSEPPGITSTLVIKNHVSCQGLSDGKAKVYIVEGTSPYTYFWAGGFTIDSVNSFSAGNKYVVIKDAKNCLDSIPFVITQPDTLQFSFIKYHPKCYNSLGSIKISGRGGTPPYQYAISLPLTFSSTDSFINLTGGLYYLSIRDANNCNYTPNYDTTSLVTPSKITATYISDSVKCFGGNDGKITISAAGGTGQLKYYKNTVLQPNNVFSSLKQGVYSIGIEDSNICSLDSNITVFQYSDISLTHAITHVNCYGATTGAILTNPTGGAGNYQYAINSGSFSSNNTFSNLPAGSYIIHVRDKNLCQKTANINITQKDSLTILLSKTHNPCFGNSLGKMKLTVSGATAPYQYSWNGGTYGSSDSFVNLSANTYNYAIKDSWGCVRLGSDIITQPSPISIGAIIDSVKCFKVNNGQIQIIAGGGTPSYMYSINNQTFISNNTYNGLAAGSYYLKIRDNNLCLKDTNIILYSSDSFYQTFFIDSIKCHNQATGKITISPVGGKMPYLYSIDGGSFTPSSIISNLTSGTHTIITKDNYGCTLSTNINLANPTPIVITIDSLINNICFGEAKGRIKISSTGAKLPHTYAWSNGTTSSINPNLTAGTYTITVMDGYNCTSTDSYLISQPSAIAFNVNKRDLRCKGDTDAFITMTISGGTPGYSYIWNTGSTSLTISNLLKGIYTLSVTDANYCKASQSVNIFEPNSIQYNLSTIPSSCKGVQNGKISITNLSGGTFPYTYLWSDGYNGIVNSNLKPFRTYVVTVTDANNCNRIDSSYIDTLYSLRVHLNPLSIPRCPYSKLSLHLIPLSGKAPYEYHLGNQFINDSGKFISIPNTVYTITVIDDNNCVYDTSIDFIPRDTMIANLINYIPKCEASNVWSSKLNVSGGGLPHTYSWPGALSVINGDSALHNVRGYYTVEVQDNYGCIVRKNFILNPLEFALQGTLDKKNLRCHNLPEGELTVYPYGGQPPYSFLWSTSETTSSIKKLTANTPYAVTISDYYNCRYSLFDTLTQPDSLWMEEKIDDPSCKSKNDGSISIKPHGGTAPNKMYMYGIDSPHILSKYHFLMPISADSHKLYLVDENKCVVEKDIILKYKYEIGVQLDSVYTVNLGSSIDIHPNLLSTILPINTVFTWVPSLGISCPDCMRTTFNGYESEHYYLKINYGNGCKDSISTYIKVIKGDQEFYVPNAFSINASQTENRVFKAYGRNIASFRMDIYNRIGEKIYSSSNISQGWDGSYQGIIQPYGIYNYIIEAETLDHRIIKRSGEVKFYY